MDPREIFKKVRQEEPKREFTFALEIGYGILKGAIWAIEKGKAKVFSISETISWNKEDELIESTDKSFSSALEKAVISEEEEPRKIIFGLPGSWVEGEKIISEKLSLLKKLCQDLGLKPIGFVVTTEAIVKYLKVLEGVPPNAILVNVGREETEISLLRLGKIIGATIVKRSQNLGEDIAEGLSRIGGSEVLPARIILYDSNEEIEEKKEEVLNYPWLKKETGFNFLHLPKAEIVSSEFDIKAVALAGGAEVAKSEGIEAEIFLEKKKPKEGKSEEKTKEEISQPIEESPDLGFGFVEEEVKTDKNTYQTEVTGLTERKVPEKKISPPKINLSRILPNFREIFSFLRLIKLPRKLPFSGVIFGVLFFSFLTGLICFWWFFPKAEVILYIKPQVLEKELKVTLDSAAHEADSAQMVIPVERIEKIVKGTKNKEVTGTKVIGEKAGGEVTIYNRTLEEKTLVQGAILVGPNGFEFLLNEEVLVASESAGPDYTRIPGKVTVPVTASEIGSEGNLASETEFAVGKYSRVDLIARSQQAFGGGSSREVRVVDKDTRESLTSSLLEELQLQVGEEMREETLSGKALVEESLMGETLTESFDKELGEEAEYLNLDLSVKFGALVYEKSRLNDLVKEKIKTSIPSGFEFREEESAVSFQLDKVIDEEKALFDASFKASLWPKIDALQIQNNLRGKKPELGEFYLSELHNIAGYEVSFNFSLPKKIKTFPKVLKNIKIEIKSRQ